MNSAKQEQLLEDLRLLNRLLMEQDVLNRQIEILRAELYIEFLRPQRGPTSPPPAKSRKQRAKK